ncbi:MAG TPA: Na+/H+ antiporter [Chloroflexia bacterium]|nr:Na+/H+ antiporter [Chloroflexia bacterium]
MLNNILVNVTGAETTGHESGATVTTVIWLLMAVAVVSVLTKYVRLPYTIALVIAGLGIALTPGLATVTLTPDLIVLVFLPALLFEAAYNLSFQHLRENIRFISSLAIWGVLATVGIVGGLLIWLSGLPWQTALVFGAIVGATDPVSVVATFRKLGAPRRLTIIMEGESLFNDGSALVIFNLLIGIVVAGQFNFIASLVDFLKVAVGGLVLGAAIGYLALGVLSRLNDYLTETLVTIIAAYGTFLGAEVIGVSPALAVVVAGLLVGNFGQERVMSPSSRVAVGLSWELIGFLANSLIFLLVGLEIRAVDISSYWEVALLAIAVVVVSRVVIIVFFSSASNLLTKKNNLPASWQFMLVWGGLRGALSLALALSLPVFLNDGTPFPDRNKILVMTFGLILFTLLVQGLTLEPFMKYLKIGNPQSEEMERYETLRGRLLTARAARQRLQEMEHSGVITRNVAEILAEEYKLRENEAEKEIKALHLSFDFLQQEQLRRTRRRLLQVEKSTARSLNGRGLISEDVLQELNSEIDAKLSLIEDGENTGGEAAATVLDPFNEAEANLHNEKSNSQK